MWGTLLKSFVIYEDITLVALHFHKFDKMQKQNEEETSSFVLQR